MTSSRSPAARFGIGLTVAGAAAVAWGVAIERRWYALRHVTAPVLSPAATQPLRVLHLSDLHQLPGQEHRLAFVRRCLDTGPDVVVASGDLLESNDSIGEVVEVLAEAAQGRVALAVLGAHDYWGATAKNPAEYVFAPERRSYGKRLDTARLVDGLTDAGYEVLDNRRETVKTPAGLIDVVGLGDPHVNFDKPELVDWSPPAEDVALRLGLCHAPYRRVLDTFVEQGMDLALCGHTHGGQLRVPVFGALVNNADLPLRQSRGLSEYSSMLLHVSAGLGHSRFAPLRFSCRPEATVLDLVAAPAPA